MTAALPPHDQAQLAALYAERNPDPAQLASERDRPVPPPPGRPMPPRARGQAVPPPPYPPPSYASQHAELREWLRTEQPSWLPELHTLGDPRAHVIIERRSVTYALALCGADGAPQVAPDIAPPCVVCKSFRPRR